jgi:hypothetical protein
VRPRLPGWRWFLQAGDLWEPDELAGASRCPGRVGAAEADAHPRGGTGDSVSAEWGKRDGRVAGSVERRRCLSPTPALASIEGLVERRKVRETNHVGFESSENGCVHPLDELQVRLTVCTAVLDAGADPVQ